MSESLAPAPVEVHIPAEFVINQLRNEVITLSDINTQLRIQISFLQRQLEEAKFSQITLEDASQE